MTQNKLNFFTIKDMFHACGIIEGVRRSTHRHRLRASVHTSISAPHRHNSRVDVTRHIRAYRTEAHTGGRMSSSKGRSGEGLNSIRNT